VDTPARLNELYDAVLAQGASRGIFITAGEFSDEARQFAGVRPLELIDGHGMLRTILKIPAQEQSYHLQMMTVGPYTTPTCPSCGKKLEVHDDSQFDPDVRLKDLTLRDRHMEGAEIHCRTLTIKAGADVQFLKPVWAQDMVVNGRAQGNVTVQGRLTVGPGGILRGLVAARTVKMEDGGTLEAEARVLNASEILPVRALPVQQVWRCPDWPKCRGQLPLR
jgi:cytoskeletal protein CcmA (bactofilin family)